jgi:hypothetical protein
MGKLLSVSMKGLKSSLVEKNGEKSVSYNKRVK